MCPYLEPKKNGLASSYYNGSIMILKTLPPTPQNVLQPSKLISFEKKIYFTFFVFIFHNFFYIFSKNLKLVYFGNNLHFKEDKFEFLETSKNSIIQSEES